mmetsp:Transcript_37520/g.112033  ORF Transcript_37520/g.112033 Transcript_37520/m.112033 type:complete len:208 (-) Transcript_37520:828-1451(-)
MLKGQLDRLALARGLPRRGCCAWSAALQRWLGDPAQRELHGVPVHAEAEVLHVRNVPEGLLDPPKPLRRPHREPPDHALQHPVRQLAGEVPLSPHDLHKLDRHPVLALLRAQVDAWKGRVAKSAVVLALHVLSDVCLAAVLHEAQGLRRLGRDAPHRADAPVPQDRRSDLEVLDPKPLRVEPAQLVPVLLVCLRHPRVHLVFPRLPV